MRQIPRVALAVCVLAGPALAGLAVAAPSEASVHVEARGAHVSAPVAKSRVSLPTRTLPLQIRTRPGQPRTFPNSPTGSSGEVVVVPGPGGGTDLPTTPSPSGRPAPSPPAPKTSTPARTTGTPEAQVLQTLNSAREDAGIAPLVLRPGLVASAHKHNVAMSKGCGLDHRCAGEAVFSARITAEGVDWNTAGENIGTGGDVPAKPAAVAEMAVRLTDMMLAEKAPDDGHRRNLLSRSFHSVGIDVYRDAAGTVWLTQDFVG